MQFVDLYSDLLTKLVSTFPKNYTGESMMNLITSRDDIIFFWNLTKTQLICIHLSKYFDSYNCLNLLPMPQPLFKVERILLNLSKTHIALYSRKGISVLKLPNMDFTTKNDTKVAKSTSIGHNLLIKDHYKLLQIKWHPGSPTDSHLLILTSDECLRLYNVMDGTELWTYSNRDLSIRLSKSLKFIYNTSLTGDTPVDFDVHNKPIYDFDNDKFNWLILILWGDGTVHKIVCALERDPSCRSFEGPVEMRPDSEDNYKMCASSILIMETSPPLIIISSSDGILYHSLLFSSPNNLAIMEKEGAEIIRKTESLFKSLEQSIECSEKLHLFEIVELELGVDTNDNEENNSKVVEENDDLICPIILEKDFYNKCRYFAIHKAGIHSISIPLIPKLFKLPQQLNLGLYEVSSTVDYLLCTSYTQNSKLVSSVPLGVAFINNSFMNNTRLLVFASKKKFIEIEIPFDYNQKQLDDEQLNIDQELGTDFQLYIQNKLTESSAWNCPLLQLPEDSVEKLPKKNWFSIISQRVDQYLNVLGNHKDIISKIEGRSGFLKTSLDNHRDDIELIKKEKTILCKNADLINEEFERLNKKQTELMNRIERLYLRMPNLNSEQNSNEIDYNDPLIQRFCRLSKEAINFKGNHELLRSYIDSQTSKFAVEKFPVPIIDSSNNKLIRKQLTVLTNEITELVRQVKALVKIMNVVSGEVKCDKLI